MIRRPPRSTLFPYTTLSDLVRRRPPSITETLKEGPSSSQLFVHIYFRPRSEEHTSELQSPDHLVCRLLLEKKKNTYINECNCIATQHLRSSTTPHGRRPTVD